VPQNEQTQKAMLRRCNIATLRYQVRNWSRPACISCF